MEIIYSEKAQEDIEYWRRSGNKAVMNKITALLNDITAHPFTGIGKPEKLKYEFSGKWSRRINEEHRIIYVADEKKYEIYILGIVKI